jgi:hypothetical protein
MRWLVGSVAAVALTGAFFGTRTLLAQEQGKGKPPAAPAAKGQEDAKKKKEERMAAFKKLFPTAKTTLAAAVEAAEKKAKGKAFEVSFGLTKDSKLDLNVELLVEDKVVVIGVDPMTGVAADPKAHTEEGEEDDDD